MSFLLQVDEIYHDESLGTNINVVLVRMIMVGYRQVSYPANCYDVVNIKANKFGAGLGLEPQGRYVYSNLSDWITAVFLQ